MLVIHYDEIYVKPVPDEAFISVITDLIKAGKEIDAIDICSKSTGIIRRRVGKVERSESVKCPSP